MLLLLHSKDTEPLYHSNHAFPCYGRPVIWSSACVTLNEGKIRKCNKDKHTMGTKR